MNVLVIAASNYRSWNRRRRDWFNHHAALVTLGEPAEWKTIRGNKLWLVFADGRMTVDDELRFANVAMESPPPGWRFRGHRRARADLSRRRPGPRPPSSPVRRQGLQGLEPVMENV